MHVDEVVVRLRNAWELQHAGGRNPGCRKAQREHRRPAQAGETQRAFPLLPGQVVAARDRSSVTWQTLRRPDMLPPAKIAAAVLQVGRISLSAALDKVIQAAAKLLGFKTVNAQIKVLVHAVVNTLLVANDL